MSPLTHHKHRLLAEAAWIRRLARHLVAGDAADDLAQDTWVKALGSPPDVGRPLRPWLYTVMNNLARRRHHAERALRRRERAATPAAGHAEVLPAVTHDERRRMLVDEVMRLREPGRSTLIRRYFEGRSSADIARQDGVPAGTVRWRLKQALDTLRARLDRQHGGDRRAWLAGLAPLCTPSHGAAMSGVALWKGAALVLAGASLVWTVSRPHDTDAPVTRVAQLEPAAEPPPASYALAERVLESAPAHDLAPAALSELRRVRLVDAAGHPLPDFRLTHVPANGAAAEWRSGDDGWLEVSGLHADDELWPWDHPELADQWTGRALDVTSVHRLDRERGEWQVTTGPTFVLELGLPPGVAWSDLEAAVLFPRHDGDPTAEVRCTAPLRPGHQPWVRFGPELERGIAAYGSPLSLVLRDRRGLWAGAVALTLPLPAFEGPVPVDVKPCAVLRGQLRDRAGQPIENGRLALQHEDGRPVRFVDGTPGGRFEMRWLEPGRHRLEAWSPQHRVRASTLALTPTEHTCDLSLDSGQHHGTVEGVASSRTGTFHGPAEVRLWADGMDGHHRVFTAPIEWSESDGRRTGRYRIDDVPAGDYQIEVRSHHYHHWSPAVQHVTESGRADFECRDDEPCVDLAFEVRDADGLPLEEFGVRYTLGDGRCVDAGSRPPGVPVIRALPLDLGIDCFVHAPGHAVWHGTLDDFDVRAGQDCRPLLTARVSLQRGWAALLRVRDPEGGPLGGADVWLDGEPVGRTGTQGTLWVRRAVRPGRVRVDYLDWRPDGADCPGEEVPFREIWNEVWLTLSP